MYAKEQFSAEICRIMRDLAFPEEAVESLLKDADVLLSHADACERFFEIVRQYDERTDIDYPGALEVMKELSSLTDVNVHALNMLHFLSLCPKLRERYEERGLPDKLFVDTMSDLRFKVYECQAVHGIWGTFVGFWFARYFSQIDRFFFKRLQLEPKPLEYDCTVGGKEYKKGAKVLNVHIPRTGTPLLHDEVVQSYREAVEFFNDYYEGEPRLIVCNSWLLSPWHDEIMRPESNILQFAHDYTILHSAPNSNVASLWAVFEHVVTEDNFDELPTDTSLRRAYVDLLKRGGRQEWTYGVFNYDDKIKEWTEK